MSLVKDDFETTTFLWTLCSSCDFSDYNLRLQKKRSVCESLCLSAFVANFRHEGTKTQRRLIHKAPGTAGSNVMAYGLGAQVDNGLSTVFPDIREITLL